MSANLTGASARRKRSIFVGVLGQNEVGVDIAGTTHLEDKTVLDQIHLGDKLSLVREENEFDEKAIVIKTADGRKLGYVPEKDNLIFSRLMDAGKLLTAKISTHELRGTFHRIGIGIYLVDY